MPVKGLKISSDEAIPMAISITALARELTSIALFPPATAALSIVLLIFETLQGVQNNKNGCYLLARRCARILLDINEQMDGRWDTAPPPLIRNLERFQDTLNSIHEFMKTQSNTRWAHRLTRKVSTENAILELNAQLRDAAQSFQIATLIDIHYTVSRYSSDRRKVNDLEAAPPFPIHAINSECVLDQNIALASVPHSSAGMGGLDRPTGPQSIAAKFEEASFTTVEPPDEVVLSDSVLGDHGFRRYHQSEVRLKGRSRLKSGWWTGVSEAEVNGQFSFIKRYDGVRNHAMKHWISDVKLLQNIYHPSLPQMIGFSIEGTPTPFILLSKVETRSPQALILNTLITKGLAACVDLVLHFYQDVTDATLYIQKQMNLDIHQAQDYVDGASYMVDGSHTVIMDLPLSRDGWITARNYGLTESLKMIVTSMLPGRGMSQFKLIVEEEESDITRRTSHLVSILRGLLPTDNDFPALSPRVATLIDVSDDEHRRPSLRQLRLSNLEANMHDHVWNESGSVPPHQFTVGDFGYIPKGEDFRGFVILGNLLKEKLAEFPIEKHGTGFQWCWKDVPVRWTAIDPYLLPDDVHCWPMAIPPGAQTDCQISHSAVIKHVANAWRFLLANGQWLADKFGVKPEDLMCITRAGTTQNFYINDFATAVQSGRHAQPFGQHRLGFGPNTIPQSVHGAPMFPHQSSVPTIMYLLTSPNSDYVPYWSHIPTSAPKGVERPGLQRRWTYQIGWCTGFVNWIQLHPEDFVG